MLTSLQLPELATTLQLNKANKRDYVYSPPDLEMSEGRIIRSEGMHFLHPTPHAHRQLATRLDIPQRYYKRLLDENPRLLDSNVNYGLKQTDKKMMLRTIDNKLRAVVSDSYRRVENETILETILPVLYNLPSQPEPLHVQITDQRMYLTFLYPGMEFNIDGKGSLKPGIRIMNSEVGLGAMQTLLFWYRDYCRNGMIWGMKDIASVRRYHRGPRVIQGEYHVVQERDTMQAYSKHLALETRDVVNTLAKPEVLQLSVDKMVQATQGKHIEQPIEAVKQLVKDIPDLSKADGNSVLESLIRGQDYSRWGLANAVTEQANKANDMDAAFKFEQLGSKVLDLKPSQWNRIVEAKAA